MRRWRRKGRRALEPPVACPAPDASRVWARRRRRRFRQGGQVEREIEEAVNLFLTDGSDSVDSKDLKVTMRTSGFEKKRKEIQKMISDTNPGAPPEAFGEGITFVPYWLKGKVYYVPWTAHPKLLV